MDHPNRPTVIVMDNIIKFIRVFKMNVCVSVMLVCSIRDTGQVNMLLHVTFTPGQ